MKNDEILIECDCCHDLFDLQQIRIDPGGMWVYCDRCSLEWNDKEEPEKDFVVP